MELATTNTCNPLVFQPSRRRRHHHHRYHYHSDSDTDSTYSDSPYSSDSDDSAYYRVFHHRSARRSSWRWPRGVVTYPGYSPWVPGGAGVGGVVGGIVQGTGLVSAATVLPQLQTQVQQQQQQQPRRYGYRRFHYQGGERVQRGCGHGHGHGHGYHHHHRRIRSPRRCILPRFGRWLIGDPPERQRWRRCDDGGSCCGDGYSVGTTPTVHHEDEYWGPGLQVKPMLTEAQTHPQRTNTVPNWAYGPDGSRNSPWRYGGPNGNSAASGPDAIDPGGTIEEVEEGGTAPVQATQTLPTTAVLPVATAAAATTIDPYDTQQPHTHYHLNDDNGRRRRRHGHSHGRHGRRRRRYDDDVDDDGVLRLIDRERRRDSERQMADADASHRREAMMMGLVDRERDRERDRGGGAGGGSAGLDARDILGVLLDGEAERRRRDVAGESGGGSSGGDGDGWKGAFDALSRRVDEMLLLGRGKEQGRRGTTDRVAAATRREKNAAPKVKFTKDSDDAGAGSRTSRRKKGVASGGKVIFSRGRDGDQDDNEDGDTDTDGDETSGPSSVGGGAGLGARGRPLRRPGSPSTYVD